MNMNRKKKIAKKIAWMVVLIPLAILAFTWIVMSLWNNILPEVLGVKTITFWQAMGILVLSKILFGGFGGKGGGKKREKHNWKNNLREKWEQMSPEQREQFKSKWYNRCDSSNWREEKQAPFQP
jgi:Ca2+/H+ antiporter, TMEM165/GDT1 family